MTQQPEALRLADEMLNYWNERGPDADAVAAELRRLHTVNERLFKERAIFLESAQRDTARITTLEAALRQAVEALVAAYQGKDKTGQVTEAITAAKQALEGNA